MIDIVIAFVVGLIVGGSVTLIACACLTISKHELPDLSELEEHDDST